MHSLKIINILIIVIIFSLFVSIKTSKEIIKLEEDQFDIQIKLSSKRNEKLFILFYIPKCLFCSHAIQTLKQNIIKNFSENDDISFAIVNLHNPKNIWLSLRFNIANVPYIILIDKFKMYEYKQSFEEKLVMDFIKEDKKLEEGLNIPQSPNFFDKLKVTMNEINIRIGKKLGKLGVNQNWGNKVVYIIIIGGIIFFIFLECMFIEYCKNLYKKIYKKKKLNIINKNNKNIIKVSNGKDENNEKIKNN